MFSHRARGVCIALAAAVAAMAAAQGQRPQPGAIAVPAKAARGRLLLGMNDVPGTCGDNRGELFVSLRCDKPPMLVRLVQDFA